MGLFSSGSAKRAAAVQAESMQKAQRIINKADKKFGQLYDPYIQAGTGALDKYMTMAGGLEAPTEELGQIARTIDPIVEDIRNADMQAVMQTPGYEFRRAEGERALQASTAAQGGLLSGQALKEAQRYGQDYSTGEFDSYLNRLYNQIGAVGSQMGGRQNALSAMYQNLNAYQPIISGGQNAAGSRAQMGMQSAAQRAGLERDIGDAQASGMIAKSNQLQSMGGQILDLAGQAAGAFATGGTSLAGGGITSAFNNGIGGQFQARTPVQGMPWLNQNAQQGAQLATASSFG